MSGDEWFDDRLTNLLITHQEATTRSPESGALTDDFELPEDARAKLERAKACIDLLAELKVGSATTACECDEAGGEINGTLDRPQKIGRFRILDELGIGGFGIVYRAWDPVTEREVAVKVPRIEVLASAEQRRRFEQEARAAARLDHPHIATVLDAGVDGMVPYITAVYYPGVTLAKWLKQHPARVTAREAAVLIKQLAEAVAHAHERGVLHRDIKPSNVLLAYHSDAESATKSLAEADPKLMDFGLAKLTAETQDMTQTGMLLGTIRYMPPEQAAGRTKEIGPASDVYGLGAVLYELLTSAPPFAGDTDLEVLRRIETAEPTSIRLVNRSATRDLETICLKCLEKSPGRRYPAAKALVDDLTRYLSGRPIQAKPSTAAQRISKWARRDPHLAALCSVIIVSAAALLVGLSWSNVRVRDERDRALASEARALESENIARQREIEALSRAYSFDVRQAKEYWSSNLFSSARKALERYVPRDGAPDMREFAWWYLHNELENARDVLDLREGKITAVVASPDGSIVATAGDDGLIRLCNVHTRAQLAELTKHRGHPIDALAFSSDGAWLASGANDGLVCVWQTPSGELARGMRHGFGWVACVAFSPDGTKLATAGSDKAIRLWDLSSGKQVGILKGHTDVVRSVVFGQGDTLFSTGEDNEVFAWDLATMSRDERLPDGRLPRGEREGLIVYALALEHDRRHLLGAFWDGGIERWCIEGEQYGQRMEKANMPPRPRCIVSDEHQMIAVGLASGMVCVMRFDSAGALIPLAHRPTGGTRVNGLAYVANGEYLLSGNTDGAARLHKAPFWALPAGIDDVGRSYGLSWQGNATASIYDGDRLVVFDVDRRVARRVATSGGIVSKAWLSPSNGIALVMCERGDSPRLIAHDIAEERIHWELDVEPRTTDLAIDDREKYVAVAGKKQMTIVDAVTGELVTVCPHPAEVDEVEFIQGTTLVVTTAHDGYVRVWEASTGELVDEYQAHTTPAKKLAVSPAGDRVLTSGDGKIRVWERSGWQKLCTIPERDNLVDAVLLDDGRTVAVLFEQGLTFWRVADGAEVLDLREDRPVNAIARNATGDQLMVQIGGVLDILDGRHDAHASSSDDSAQSNTASAIKRP